MRHSWIPRRSGREPVDVATTLLRSVESQPAWMQDSRIGRRLTAALSHVVETGAADEMPDHLRYLAEQDDEHTYNRYSLVRFVVAVTPILGFLGTVVHFGTALSGLSFKNMDQELSHVVSEMGTAFNTTTVALGAAMVTMFSMFLCERIENGLVARINRFAERELANRFQVQSASMTPCLAEIKLATEASLSAVVKNAAQHLETLSVSLNELFQRFDDRQQNERVNWQTTLSEFQLMSQKMQLDREDHLARIVAITDARSDDNMRKIQSALEQATSFSQDVATLANTMNSIASGEGQLTELQALLTQNLRVLHETNQIDRAFHSLTAAIHLLTLRNGGSAVRDAA